MIRSHSVAGAAVAAAAGGVAAPRATRRMVKFAPEILSLAPPEWTERAACNTLSAAESDRLFYSRGQTSNDTYQLCNSCPVQSQCLADNLHEEYGVFGGMNSAERLALRGGPQPGRRRTRGNYDGKFAFAS